MNSFYVRIAILSACLAFAIAANKPLAAHADAADALTASGSGGSLSVNLAVRGDVERDDLFITAPLRVGVSVLKQYDAGKYILLDDSQKIYAVTPLANAPLDFSGIPNVLSVFQPYSSTPQSQNRAVTVTITVSDLGMAAAPDVPGVRAHHYAVGMVSTSLDGNPADNRRLHTDIWADPRLQRPDAPDAAATTRIVTLPGGGKVIYTLKGDIALYNQALRYLPVELFGLGLGGSSAALKQTAASTAALDAAKFAVPAGYKQLSLDDFSTTEQNALLDLISGPQPKLPNAQPTPVSPNTQNTMGSTPPTGGK